MTNGRRTFRLSKKIKAGRKILAEIAETWVSVHGIDRGFGP
ncbi:hypothetical protein SAMN05421636_102450 [Pricia antarctica]|uniref:Uncharacterized protein n=1 Tax=Pricia antarctica TaxID=641691 RepID=A0A1G6Z119_9FLAO|nr:hypothetical protein SAMN05421636_102450 [Pricia antarctica]